MAIFVVLSQDLHDQQFTTNRTNNLFFYLLPLIISPALFIPGGHFAHRGFEVACMAINLVHAHAKTDNFVHGHTVYIRVKSYRGMDHPVLHVVIKQD